MEAYAYFLQFIIVVAWVGLGVATLVGLRIAVVELYDAIRKNRFSWSHILAAPIAVAGYVISPFVKQTPGRHADGHVTFWTEVLEEAIADSYSLTRTENNVHALKYATHA